MSMEVNIKYSQCCFVSIKYFLVTQSITKFPIVYVADIENHELTSNNYIKILILLLRFLMLWSFLLQHPF